MRLYGLTGGIGMGKSAASNLLTQAGWAVVDTDQVARDVVLPGQPALAELVRLFGPSILHPDGTLNRPAMAERVFGDSAARAQLEGVLHPRIRNRWRATVEEWRAAGLTSGVVVIPLLFETGAQSALDVTVCMACSEATATRRLRERGWSLEEIQRRRLAQWPLGRKMEAAHHVVWNEGSLTTLGAQLERVFRR